MISPTPFLSRIPWAVRVFGTVSLAITLAGAAFVAAHKSDNDASALASPKPLAATPADAPAKARISESFGKLPLSFEFNKGQTDPSVKFLSHGLGYDLFLTSTEAVLTVQKPRTRPIEKIKGPGATNAEAEPNEANVRERSVLRLKMIGANSAPEMEGRQELPGKINYFAGNNPEKWLRNVPTYRQVHFKEVYPGIDLVYYGNQRELEYDLVVAPGANPKLIRFSVEGAERIRLDQTGNLVLALQHGDLSLKKPVIYQLTEQGNRRELKGAYVVSGNEIRFKVQSFDSGKPLVIDPVLSYSTLLGSGGNEHALGIAVDSFGSAYVTGVTDSSGFPTTAGAFKTSSFSSGAFVSKLDPTGSTLVYSTYLNGNNGLTTGNAITVDSSGNAHVTGFTTASDFPVVNGLKTSANFFKSTDSAANWNNNNSGLTGDVQAIAVSPSNPNTIYAGSVSGPHRSTDGGATWTKTPTTGLPVFPFAFSMAVDPTAASIVYAGFINGGLFKSTNGGDNWSAVNIPLNSAVAFAIVFDPSTPSTMYVGAGNGVFKSTDSGSTWITQNNFGIPGVPNVRALAIDPTSPSTIYAGTLGSGFFKSTNGGGNWTAMNSGMGGPNPTVISAIAIDPFNSATIYTGHGSNGFGGSINKSTNGGASWTPMNNGVPQSQITALIADRSAPSTLYASTSADGVIKTTNGAANWTSANTGLWKSNVRTLVAHPSSFATFYAGTGSSTTQDAFVTKLNPSGSGLLFSTYLGGSLDETGNGIAVDNSGNIYVAGLTNSTNYPVLNPVQSGPSATENCINAFVTKLNPAVPSFVFSTYLGGSKCDVANSVAIDSTNNVYVTGSTSSTDFPTAGPIQAALADPFNGDVFVTKLTNTGSLAYSTYLGGNGSETGFGIAVDSSSNAYVTGTTTSSNFPTANPIQASNGGSAGDAFVSKLNAQGSALVYSTYLGGAGTDVSRGIAVDSSGNAYITGFTGSVDFPIVAGALRTKSSLYKSVNGGANWTNDNYGLNASSLTSLAVDPAQPATVYAGTNAGVFKSTNAGRTWSAVNNGLNVLNILALVIDPATPTTLYVATNDFASPNNGIYKTTDGGASWNLRKTGLTNATLLSLAIDPVTPTTLYVGVVGGIYKTTNGADNWAQSGSTPPTFPVSIAVNPHTHTTVFAVESSSAGGVFRSIDSGATWQPVGFAQTGPHGSFVGVSPLTPGLVYAATLSGGIFKSVDGGDNWSAVPNIHGRIVFDPVSPSTLYLLSNNLSPTQGLLKSTNGGQTWTAINKGLASPTAIALAIHPQTPSTLYLASGGAGDDDAFVTKINAAGSSLIYSTLLGGVPAEGDSLNTNDAAFAIALDSAGNAYVTGLARSPAFPVTPNAYQPFLRRFDEVFISKLTMSHIISGHVFSFGGGSTEFGAEVVLSDATSLTSVVTDSDGSYEFSHLREGGSFTVSASKPHFTMTPVSQSFNNLTSDQVVDFTTLTSDSPFYTISGQITDNGNPLAGVTVTLSGSQSGIRTTDSNGNYSFELIVGGNYTVTPSIVGFTFGPTSQTFNSLSGPQIANFTATRQSFVVTNANNHGSGSLREAIINANATAGTDTIVFNIPGPGVKTINLLIALPDITDPVVIDATTQPGYAGTPRIELDGASVGDASGLTIKASSTVRGFAIGRFRNAGIQLSGCDNNVIQGNYIGLDASGTVARSNSNGILVALSSNNLIGGTTAAARNVISASGFDGIGISGNDNVIQGNFIGTNAAGTAAISNGISGISISSSPFANTLIGGTAPGAGNLISGNQRGITTNGSATTIQGNLIGTNVTGTSKIPNGTGVDARGTNTLVGGLTPGARNVISGNDGDGVTIGGNGARLQGNYIGTDITGTLPLGNGASGVVAGDNALIGGTVPEARNIISANGGFGNISLGSNSSGSAAVVQGNYIGTDVTGTRALGGSVAGITIFSNNNIIGGLSAGARNVLSGNQIGIQLGGFSTSAPVNNVIQGNFIGLNAAGAAPLPNTLQGIAFSDGFNNIVGGTQSGAANTIAFNGAQGIFMTAGTGNSIRGNSIFSNNLLGIDLGGRGVTANDGTDPDTGPNNLQNFPVLTSVLSSGGNTTIQGSLNSIPNTTFQIDFYSSAAVDPAGNGEGALFFNTTPIMTDGNGNATINVTFPASLGAGRVVTATATDPNGNTSEFSAGDATNATGSVQFSVSSLNAIEDVGLLTINVLRIGGSAGNLSVQYATADGTAIAGQDYTSTSGTLNFSNGETSKTLQIPIADDATTEPDETFTVALSNAASLEALGPPSTLTVTIQDRSTTLFLGISNASVIEGNTGSTTNALFTVNLSAATGRSISVDYATSNLSAFGGAACGTAGVDYETTSGTLSFPAGTTSLTIPVKVCGDTSAEANEMFRVTLSNGVNALLLPNQGFGVITNDDVLSLLLEDLGQAPNQAAALDALLSVRDPFRIVTIPDWFAAGPDRNTRVILFAQNLQLNPGESASAVIVRLIGSNNQIFDVPAEDVRAIPNTDFTQVIFRLPDNLPAGTCALTIRAHGRVSNMGTIRIAQ
jgi:photosystem II stability/assembly factor-like uncharacterized protein